MDLNPCGGAEQVAIATLQAIIEMGVDNIDLTTARIPDISKLKNAFGDKTIDAIFNHIKKVNLLDSLSVSCKDRNESKDTVTINTHGDMLPHYLPHFSRNNSIVYCHYPLAIELATQHDPAYLKFLADLDLVTFYQKDNNRDKSANLRRAESDKRAFWQSLYDNYLMMLEHSTILTNSRFSKDAILKVLLMGPNTQNTATFSSAGHIVNQPLIIPPPVNVEEFRDAALYSRERDDLIVVVSRFNPSKKLENAILLAQMLKKQKIGKGMIIAGGLMPEDRDYYSYILKMIKTYDLSSYVRLRVNITSDALKSIMSKGKVYFHPMRGEPFGISIAEAMSAGLVPIVPVTGGQTDFVAQKYRYASLADAAAKISWALNVSQEERNEISDMVASFSCDNYVKNIQKVITNLLQDRQRIELDTSVKAQLRSGRTAAA